MPTKKIFIKVGSRLVVRKQCVLKGHMGLIEVLWRDGYVEVVAVMCHHTQDKHRWTEGYLKYVVVSWPFRPRWRAPRWFCPLLEVTTMVKRGEQGRSNRYHIEDRHGDILLHHHNLNLAAMLPGRCLLLAFPIDSSSSNRLLSPFKSLEDTRRTSHARHDNSGSVSWQMG